MKILIDTSVWSMVLRRPTTEEIKLRVTSLLEEEEVLMMGLIRQEILSGIKSRKQFNQLKEYLRAFPDLELKEEIHELAAEYFSKCRKKGIQGSHIDFLICAVAVYFKSHIYTLDKDFIQYQKVLPIKIYLD